MRILYAIPQYNEIKFTSQCLTTLFNSPKPTDIDIIVIDNGSTESLRPLKKFPVEIHIMPKNLKWLGTFNYLVKNFFKKYDFIIYSNNDVLVCRNFLINYYRTISGGGRFGILAPHYNDVNRFQHLRGQNYNTFQAGSSTINIVPYVDGTIFSVSKELYERIGGFDPIFKKCGGWGADIDYCIRAKRQKFKIGVSNSLYFDHIKSITSRKYEPNRPAYYGTFQHLLRNKYRQNLENLMMKV